LPPLSRVDETRRRDWTRENPVRIRREQRGLSRATIALHLGVSPATVAAIESGVVDLTEPRATELSKLYACRPKTLWTEWESWRNAAPIPNQQAQ